MIIGIGNDIVDLRRLQRVASRYPQRFPRVVLSDAEHSRLPPPPQDLRFLAGRWAAKEALGKAIGCGVRHPLTFREITVANEMGGAPRFIFSPIAATFIELNGVKNCHLSLSHDGNYACAMVIAEGNGT